MSYLLTLNGGSSSIKFALFDGDLTRVMSGQFSRIGLAGTTLAVTDGDGKLNEIRELQVADHASCIPILIHVVGRKVSFNEIVAVGHRIVHGGARFIRPELLN